MRPLSACLAVAALCVLPAAASAQTQQLPEAAVVVVTLDDARQGQIKHGRGLLDSLGDERFGRFRLLEPSFPVNEFRHCEEDSPDYGLEYCARFYLHRGWTEGSPPHVVVVFDDRNPQVRRSRHPDEMRVLCYGRGAEAADAAAQDTWLWPGSYRIHGMRDLERDLDALAGCITAALSETPGVPRPRPL